MPEHSAAQALPYVLLLQPQTGSYCKVQGQFGLIFSTHLFDLQEKERKRNPKAKKVRKMFFIGKNL
jgi:hypothetical protein